MATDPSTGYPAGYGTSAYGSNLFMTNVATVVQAANSAPPPRTESSANKSQFPNYGEEEFDPNTLGIA